MVERIEWLSIDACQAVVVQELHTEFVDSIMSVRSTSATGPELPEGGTCVTKWLVQTERLVSILKNLRNPSSFVIEGIEGLDQTE
jgi:hypothetical protein